MQDPMPIVIDIQKERDIREIVSVLRAWPADRVHFFVIALRRVLRCEEDICEPHPQKLMAVHNHARQHGPERFSGSRPATNQVQGFQPTRPA